MGGDAAGEATRWFGVRGRERTRERVGWVGEGDVPGAGELLLVTGGSGAGKTTLLREVAWWAGVRGWEARWVGGERLGRGLVAGLFRGAGAAEALSALGAVGLAEAGVLFRRASALSEGERYRLRVGLALWSLRRAMAGRGGLSSRGVLLVMDEFASGLDAVTAMGVAGAVGRAIEREGRRVRVAAAVGTWRGELAGMLRPTRWLRADYGRVVDVLGARAV